MIDFNQLKKIDLIHDQNKCFVSFMRFGLRSKDLSLTYLKATQPPSILRPLLSHLRELVVAQDCKVSIYEFGGRVDVSLTLINIVVEKPINLRAGFKCRNESAGIAKMRVPKLKK